MPKKGPKLLFESLKGTTSTQILFTWESLPPPLAGVQYNNHHYVYNTMLLTEKIAILNILFHDGLCHLHCFLHQRLISFLIRKTVQLKLVEIFFNPLTPMPAVTDHVKTQPQFPLLALTGCKNACEDNCLSYPP